MKVIVDLCVVPMGVGVSVSKYVTECQRVLEELGLEHKLHAYGTNIAGDWDEVFSRDQAMPRARARIGCTTDYNHRESRHQSRSRADNARQDRQRRDPITRIASTRR